MSRERPWSRRTLIALTVVCWLLAMSVQFFIVGTAAPSPSGPGLSEDHNSLVARVFGSSRTLLSGHLFLEADRYFHKGIRLRATRAFDDTLLIRWADQIAPTRHEEVAGSELSEIMPWLQMSIGSDPQNFDAWAAAGYWLLQQGNMNAAVDLLRKAQQENPADYRFFAALGQLFFFNQDLAPALEELARAEELWPAFSRQREEDHLRGLGEILTLQAGIHEALGNRDVALEKYRALHEIFPLRTYLSVHIAELESGTAGGQAPPLSPRDQTDLHHHLLPFRDPDSHVHHADCTHHE